MVGTLVSFLALLHNRNAEGRQTKWVTPLLKLTAGVKAGNTSWRVLLFYFIFPIGLLSKQQALYNPPPPFFFFSFLKKLLYSFEMSQQKLKPVCLQLQPQLFPEADFSSQLPVSGQC